jgi:chemotaxis protein MotA
MAKDTKSLYANRPDPTTFLGVIFGIAILFVSIGVENGMKFFINIPSLYIVLGGTFAATLVNFPITQLFKFFSWMKVIFSMKKIKPEKVVDKVVEISEMIKVDGKLAVVSEVEKIKYHFLRHGFQLVLDKIEPNELNILLSDEVRAIQKRHDLGITFFETLAAYAPGYGLLGTLIGLIMMLSNLDDPKTIGPNMGIALVTTFYGVLFSNLIFLPLAGRLQILSDEEQMINEMIVVGLKSLSKSDPHIIVKEKMLTYLSASERRKHAKKKKR